MKLMRLISRVIGFLIAVIVIEVALVAYGAHIDFENRWTAGIESGYNSYRLCDLDHTGFRVIRRTVEVAKLKMIGRGVNFVIAEKFDYISAAYAIFTEKGVYGVWQRVEPEPVITT